MAGSGRRHLQLPFPSRWKAINQNCCFPSPCWKQAARSVCDRFCPVYILSLTSANPVALIGITLVPWFSISARGSCIYGGIGELRACISLGLDPDSLAFFCVCVCWEEEDGWNCAGGEVWSRLIHPHWTPFQPPPPPSCPQAGVKPPAAAEL